MPYSDAWANKVLDGTLGGTALSKPTPVEFRLYTVMPNADGTGGTEASYTGYAALSVTNNATNFPNATSRLKSNGTVLDYGTAGVGANQTIVGMAVWDPAGPTMMLFGTLATSKVVQEGDPVKFNIGDFDFLLPAS